MAKKRNARGSIGAQAARNRGVSDDAADKRIGSPRKWGSGREKRTCPPAQSITEIMVARPKEGRSPEPTIGKPGRKQ